MFFYCDCVRFIAGDFLNANGVYEDLTEFPLVKKYMEEQLEDYNMTPGYVGMDLVLFRDAIEHGIQNMLPS